MIIIDNGVTILEFGDGDIFVGGGYLVERKTPSVSFMQNEKGEMGREWPEAIGKIDTDLNVKVRMIFNKIESIDIVIEQLQIAKKYFKGD